MLRRSDYNKGSRNARIPDQGLLPGATLEDVEDNNIRDTARVRQGWDVDNSGASHIRELNPKQSNSVAPFSGPQRVKTSWLLDAEITKNTEQHSGDAVRAFGTYESSASEDETDQHWSKKPSVGWSDKVRREIPSKDLSQNFKEPIEVTDISEDQMRQIRRRGKPGKRVKTNGAHKIAVAKRVETQGNTKQNIDPFSTTKRSGLSINSPPGINAIKIRKSSVEKLKKKESNPIKDHNDNLPLNVCQKCGIKCEVQLCARCFSVGYCSRQCQKADWKAHKKTCVEKKIDTEDDFEAVTKTLTEAFMELSGKQVDDNNAQEQTLTERENVDESIPPNPENDSKGEATAKPAQEKTENDAISVAERPKPEPPQKLPEHSMRADVESNSNINRNTSDRDRDFCPCGTIGDFECSACGTVSYCSSTCQRKYWPEHRDVCKELKKRQKASEMSIPVPQKETPPNDTVSHPQGEEVHVVETKEAHQESPSSEKEKENSDIEVEKMGDVNSILDAKDVDDALSFWKKTSKNDVVQEALPSSVLSPHLDDTSNHMTKTHSNPSTKESDQYEESNKPNETDGMFGSMLRSSQNEEKKSYKTRTLSDDEGEEKTIPALKGQKGRTQDVDKFGKLEIITKAHVGERVNVSGYGAGRLKFFGGVEFADPESGDWCGIVLDEPNGKNDGTVKGVKYFNCEPHKGVFVSLRSGKCRLAQTARPNTRHAWGGGELEDLPVIKPKVKRPNRITVQSIPLTEMLPESKEFVLTNKPDVKISNDLYNEMKINENDNNYAEYSDNNKSGAVGPDAVTPGDGSMLYAKGTNEMHHAANRGDYEKLESLIKSKKYDVDCEDFEGRAPLLHAVHKHHYACVELLIKNFAEVNHRCKDGSTALHEAAYNSTVEILNLLLRHDANPRARDQDGREPLHWSTDNPSGPQCMVTLIQRFKIPVDLADDADMTTLMWAACHNQASMVESLLARGADLFEKDMDGKTALDWAVHEDSIAAMKLLLDLPGTYFKDRRGRTVLHTAAERNAILAIEYILSTRSDAIEDVDFSGRTPLFWAVACNKIEATRVLLGHGANMFHCDRANLSCMDYAKAKEHMEIVRILETFQENLQLLGLKQVVSINTGGKEEEKSPDSILKLIPTAEEAAQSTPLKPDLSSIGSTSPLNTPLGNNSKEKESSPRKVRPRIIIELLRFQEKFETNSEEPTLSPSLQHDEILSWMLNPKGQRLSKYSGEGTGKAHQRFFRVFPRDDFAEIVWAKTPEDLERLRMVSSAGIKSVGSTLGSKLEQREDFDSENVFAFVVHTTLKPLFLSCETKVERDAWVKGLNHILGH
eukprot:m.342307 g.342307  ORF g.342307 m.342307 type:complete len:1322 (+) comp21234_c0_seq1:202-4167(+)